MAIKLTKSKVINQFIRKHGDRYDYSLVEYKNSKIKVDIICKIHGVFSQQPSEHKKGQNCPSCSSTKKKIKDLKQHFITIFGNYYDYSKFITYKNTHTKIDIICPIHGVFKMSPHSHNQGQGCKKCANKSKCLPKDKVLQSFLGVHGDLYDYSLMDYITTDNKISIICPKHGVFTQTSSEHKNGAGCPYCANSLNKQYFKNKRTILYYFKIDDCYKIGVTTKQTIRQRYSLKEYSNFKEIHQWIYEDGINAIEIEQFILKKFKHKRTDKILLNSGNTELFKEDILLEVLKVINRLSK